MKLLKCIIRAEKLSEAVSKLAEFVPGMTVSEVRGYGHEKGHSAVYRGIEYAVELLPKVMIEIVIDDTNVDDVIRLVTQTARTGNIGDGRIFVLPVLESYHVRTGFMDRD